MKSTLPTSHGYEPKDAKIASPFPKSAFVDAKKPAFVSNFEFVGSVDTSPYLCVPAALKWRENLGGEDVIMKYCTTLAQDGAKLVAQIFGTEVMQNSTNTLGNCCLSNIRLPISVYTAQQHALQAGMETSEVGAAVRDWMSKTSVEEYDTFVQSLFYNGAWWVRLSGQVYLGMEDMEWAGRTLLGICERVNAGEWV